MNYELVANYPHRLEGTAVQLRSASDSESVLQFLVANLAADTYNGIFQEYSITRVEDRAEEQGSKGTDGTDGSSRKFSSPLTDALVPGCRLLSGLVLPFADMLLAREAFTGYYETLHIRGRGFPDPASIAWYEVSSVECKDWESWLQAMVVQARDFLEREQDGAIVFYQRNYVPESERYEIFWDDNNFGVMGSNAPRVILTSGRFEEPVIQGLLDKSSIWPWRHCWALREHFNLSCGNCKSNTGLFPLVEVADRATR